MGFVFIGLETVIFVILLRNVSSKRFLLLVLVSLRAFVLICVIGLAFGLDKSELQLVDLIVPLLDFALQQNYLAIESLDLSKVLGRCFLLVLKLTEQLIDHGFHFLRDLVIESVVCSALIPADLHFLLRVLQVLHRQ